MNDMKVFENPQFGKIRTILIGDKPWFVANDVLKVLEINNSKDTLRTLDDDEKSGVDIIDPPWQKSKNKLRLLERML